MNQMTFQSSQISVWDMEKGYVFKIVKEMKDCFSRYRHTMRFHQFIYLVYSRRGPAFLISDKKLNMSDYYLYKGPLLIPYTDIHWGKEYVRNPRIHLMHAFVEEIPKRITVNFEGREDEFFQRNTSRLNYTGHMSFKNGEINFETIVNKGEFKDGNIAVYQDELFLFSEGAWKKSNKTYQLPNMWKEVNKNHVLIIISGLTIDSKNLIEISDLTMMFSLNDKELLNNLNKIKISEDIDIPRSNMRIIHKYGDRIWGNWRNRNRYPNQLNMPRNQTNGFNYDVARVRPDFKERNARMNYSDQRNYESRNQEYQDRQFNRGALYDPRKEQQEYRGPLAYNSAYRQQY